MNPPLKCGICAGPIGQGEPAVIYVGGTLAHYFKSTCNNRLDRIKKIREWQLRKGRKQ